MFEVAAPKSAGHARGHAGALAVQGASSDRGHAGASSGRATGRRRLERGRIGKCIPSSRIGSAICFAKAPTLGTKTKPARNLISAYLSSGCKPRRDCI